MPDLALLWADDVAITHTGDLALADGAALARQRILRRLLTNPGDYIWHPEYGAGLAAMIGQPVRPAAIAARIRSQLALESAVAATPAPRIDVSADQGGAVFVSIRYADAATGQTGRLEFSL